MKAKLRIELASFNKWKRNTTQSMKRFILKNQILRRRKPNYQYSNFRIDEISKYLKYRSDLKKLKKKLAKDILLAIAIQKAAFKSQKLILIRAMRATL